MIPVCWYEGIAGLYAHEGAHGRSRYACCGMLNEMFDLYECEHFSGWSGLPKDAQGAVVIIHGGHLRDQVHQINADCARLRWVIFIGIGDEENDFPYTELRHPNMKLWMQSPIPNKSKADRFPIVGYPCDAKELMVRGEERTLDWFFAGQVTHERRYECMAQLCKMPGGKLLGTQRFYSGMEHAEYFKTVGQAKVIPCPSGPVCPDTFRLAEALEAGCIPIVDDRPGWKPDYPGGFWNVVFPQGVPFPILNNWADLPRVMQDILMHYDENKQKVSLWWAEYKKKYNSWLGEDLKVLGAM